MVYNLKFSERMADAAKSFISKEEAGEEAARAVLYLSLVSCEISLKALLEKAGFSVKELKKRSHDLKGLLKDVCACELTGTEIGNSQPMSASRLLAQVVDGKIANGTVGALLSAETKGASKYPNDIRYGELVTHFPAELMYKCAQVVLSWAKENIDKIKRK